MTKKRNLKIDLSGDINSEKAEYFKLEQEGIPKAKH